MTFYNQLSQAFSYSGTLFNRPPGGTLLLRRLHERADLILTGHLHSLPIGEGGYNSTPLLNCGATLQTIEVENTFALIQIEEGRFVCQFYRTDKTLPGNRWIKEGRPRKILCNAPQGMVNSFLDNRSLSSLRNILSEPASDIQTPSGELAENTMPIAPEFLISEHDNIGININVLLEETTKQLEKAELHIKKLEFTAAFNIIDQVEKGLEPLGSSMQSDRLSEIYTRIALIECTRTSCLHLNRGAPEDYSRAKKYLERAKNAQSR